MVRCRYDPDASTGLGSDAVSRIIEDRTGIIWIGTRGGGISKLNEQALRFRRYTGPLFDAAEPPLQPVTAILRSSCRQSKRMAGTRS